MGNTHSRPPCEFGQGFIRPASLFPLPKPASHPFLSEILISKHLTPQILRQHLLPENPICDTPLPALVAATTKVYNVLSYTSVQTEMLALTSAARRPNADFPHQAFLQDVRLWHEGSSELKTRPRLKKNFRPPSLTAKKFGSRTCSR